MESNEVEKKRVTFSRLSFLSKPVVSSFFVSPTLTLSKDHFRRSLITGSGKDRQRQLCVWVTRGYLRKREEGEIREKEREDSQVVNLDRERIRITHSVFVTNCKEIKKVKMMVCETAGKKKMYLGGAVRETENERCCSRRN